MTTAGFLAGGGEMGALMRAHDWEHSPLGPPAGWPASLKTAVSLCLGSDFPMLIWWGPELVLLYNDAYRPMLGDKHPSSLGAPGRAVWGEIWEVIGPMLSTVLERGESTWSEDQLLLMNRHGYLEETYFTFSYGPIRDDPGAVAGVFTAVTETTERMLGTRRLLALTRFADLTAPARTHAEVTRAATAALGDASDDVPLAVLYVVDDGVARLGGVQGVAAGGALAPEQIDLARDTTPWDIASIVRGAPARLVEGLEIPARDGTVVTCAQVVPVPRGGSGPPREVLVLGVSPRRRFDDDYRSFFTVLAGQLAAALARAEALEAETARADTLAELDKSKTEFFSNVSHEFRTPLMLMLGPLGDAIADSDGAQQERLELAQRSALRLLRLVNALLDFSRMEAGRAAASFVPVDLAQLITETAAVFRAATERSRLALVVDVPDGEQIVEADRDMLDKVLLNLLSNAYKFTFQGTIEVRLRLGERAVIEVTDTGVGIPDEEQPRLFDRFHRVEGAMGRSHEGSGIGLALVAELVSLHGGQVGVESQVGRGTTFRVELPLRQPETHQGTDHDDALAAAQRAGYALEAMRWDGDDPVVEPADGHAADVLIADDNADMRSYLARLLSPHYAVRTAIDGEDALAKLHDRLPDLLLTDVMMPRLDGFALIAKLRGDPRTKRLPVIMLSARAGEEATVEGLDAGADDYLVKPFSPAELMARVRANLEVVRLRDALAAGERERAKEMEGVALTLQRSLLPRALPDVLGAQLAGRYVPAGRSLEIGGDFYDATELGDGRVAIAIGDVAGHGVLAAAVMGQVRQALRAYLLEGHEPAGTMARLDRLVHESQLVMTTCLFGIFDPERGRLRYANAGHPPPLLRRADGSVERLTGALSHPLGAAAGSQHVQAEVELAVGDTLLLYTDGLVERRGEMIDEGIDRLAARLAAAEAAPEKICKDIEGALAPGLTDDVAILALVRAPMAAEELRVVVTAHPDRLADLRRRVAAWLAGQGAGLEEREDVVLAVHEAAMNAVEHAYGPGDAELEVTAVRRGDDIVIEVADQGRWRDPRDARRGRGQGIMHAVMDHVAIDTGPKGSTVTLSRRLEGSA